MDTEALSRSPFGRIFIRMMASMMESRLRYKFFGPKRIIDGAGIVPGMMVLEVGCGTGFFTIPIGQMLGEQGSLIAMDVLPASVEEVKRKVEKGGLHNVRVIKDNALDTKLEKESLDEVIIFGVIPAPMIPMQKLLAEMHRVLRPGGVLAVWPPSWVHRSITHSQWFEFVHKRNGVYTYRRVDVQVRKAA